MLQVIKRVNRPIFQITIFHINQLKRIQSNFFYNIHISDTCINGVQDDNEGGIDCGGPCGISCSEYITLFRRRILSIYNNKQYLLLLSTMFCIIQRSMCSQYMWEWRKLWNCITWRYWSSEMYMSYGLLWIQLPK